MVEKQIFFLAKSHFDVFWQFLLKEFTRVIAPQVRNGDIVYDELVDSSQLPWGVVDEQSPGHYQIKQTNKKTLFSWVNGSQAIKPHLFKSKESLWRVERNAHGQLAFIPMPAKKVKTAIFAVRPCDLRAMLIQDKVFLQEKYVDEHYQAYRKNLFVIVANCIRSSANCFCVSAGGYTSASTGYDMALTEISSGFILQPGNQKAIEMLTKLQLPKASKRQINQAEKLINKAAHSQKKRLPDLDLNKTLFANLDHPQYEDIANRCLACGNCTQVCPTCFCHSQKENPSVDGNSSEHIRQWDSCFNEQHSYIHGKIFRESILLRYRQWLTHKLGSWHDQFATSGCVGCGRCITWCPVGIDITVETSKICQQEHKT